MPKKAKLNYVETEGGPFILLPVEHKKSWNGAEGDYERATAFGSGVGVVDVGAGKAPVLGTAEVTAFLPAEDGGVFIQRVYGDDDAAVVKVVEKALTAKWESKNLQLDVGKGKLALFDSALSYADTDADQRLMVTLPPGKYAVSRAPAKGTDIELGLVRLQRV
jgi:hypothetical protein